MWRDRTNLYVSYRQSYAHHPTKKSRYTDVRSNGYSDNGAVPEEQRGLMAGGSYDDRDAVIEMDVLPPRWLDVQDEVSRLLDAISKQMTRLDGMHAKHVLPGFEDESVKQKEERDIERLTQEITRGFQSCQRAIKRIEQTNKESRQHGYVNQSEEVISRNLQISLATRVGEVSASFRKKQSSYLKKLKSLSGMAVPGDNYSFAASSNPYADPSLMESDADRSFSQTTLQQAQTQRQRTGNDAMIAQREKEIEDIAQGIIELANIFQDLQTMVIDQGTLLDRIDYNVERMATDVKAADQELNTATTYQKRGTKRNIILLLVILIVGLIIILATKPLRRKSSESPTPPSTEPPAPPQLVERQPP
ncbi:MAG: hypothetical protein Q9162_006618 [Coniocarpon cinnabarinum]